MLNHDLNLPVLSLMSDPLSCKLNPRFFKVSTVWLLQTLCAMATLDIPSPDSYYNEFNNYYAA